MEVISNYSIQFSLLAIEEQLIGRAQCEETRVLIYPAYWIL